VRATDAAGNTDGTPATQTWTIQSAPADHQPVAAYAYTPASPTIGQAVSFDASSATCDDTPCTYTWEDDGGDGPAGDQWPLGGGKTMSFTFQEAGRQERPRHRRRRRRRQGHHDEGHHRRSGRPAGRHDGAGHDDQLRPDRHHQRRDADLRVHLERERVGVPVPARLGGVGELHQPVDDGDPARRGAHRLGARHRRRGQRRCDAGHAAFTVDNRAAGRGSAPNTTIGSGPSGPTNDTTPTFAFSSSESGSTFQCRVDTGSWATCTSPWTTSVLAAGAHSVSVRATDAAGNTDPSPATRSLTVDTSAPNTTIDSAPPVLSPGSSATVTFSASESGATFECRLDGGAWAACASPKTYTGLSLAQHTVDVRATDVAGNVDASPASANWTSITLPGDGSGSGGSGSGSDSEAPTLTLSAPSPGATFTSTLNMAAAATDNRAVSKIEFWFDGSRVARDTSAPYTATFTAGRGTSLRRAHRLRPGVRRRGQRALERRDGDPASRPARRPGLRGRPPRAARRGLL
jgi:hypothetical protein